MHSAAMPWKLRALALASLALAGCAGSPLIRAFDAGDAKAVKAWLDQGVDVNASARELGNERPLAVAARPPKKAKPGAAADAAANRTAVVKLLLSRGAQAQGSDVAAAESAGNREAAAMLARSLRMGALKEEAKQAPKIVWEPSADAARERRADAALSFIGHEAMVRSVALSPSGLQALSGGDDRTLRLWDLETGKPLKSLQNRGGAVLAVAVSPGRRVAVLGNDERELNFWDLEAGTLLKSVKAAADGPVTSVAFSPDGRFVLSGGGDKSLKLWEAKPGRFVRSYAGSGGAVFAVAFSSDGSRVLSAGSDALIRLWDAAGGSLVASLEGHEGPVLSIAVSKDGRFLLSGGGDKTLRLWDIQAGRLIKTLTGHGKAVRSVALSPDGRYGLSGSDDGTVRLWDLEKGSPLQTFVGHSGWVLSVALSSDLRYALSGGSDRTLRRWDVLLPLAKSLGKSGFQLVSDIASWNLKTDMAKISQLTPPAPKLVQEKYEKQAEFDLRVQEAQNAFDKETKEFSALLSRLEERRRTMAIGRALRLVFGNPTVRGAQYDPDSQRFTLSVSGDEPLADALEVRLTFKEGTPPAKAETLEAELLNAGPAVGFALDSGRLTVAASEVRAGSGRYAAVPAAGGARILGEVDLSSLAAETAGETRISIDYSISPELAGKAQELENLKLEKARQAAASRLESELKKLRSDGHRVYSAEVDEPKRRSPRRPQDFALVIGVGRYKKLPEAAFAERDADAVKKQLLALGVPEENMIHVAGEDATRGQLDGYLDELLPKNVGPDSRLYVYFSGHGAPDPQTGDAYLMPWDGDASMLNSTAVPLAGFYARLGRLKAAEIIVFLDACFSGAGGRSVLAKGARPLVTKLVESALDPRITLFAAASAEEITGSMDSSGHGMFTYYLLKTLQEHEGPVKASGLFSALKPKVQAEARRQNRFQTPVFRGVDVQLP